MKEGSEGQRKDERIVGIKSKRRGVGSGTHTIPLS